MGARSPPRQVPRHASDASVTPPTAWPVPMPPPPLNLYKLPGWIIPLTRYSSAWFTSGDFRVIQPLGHLQPRALPAAGRDRDSDGVQVPKNRPLKPAGPGDFPGGTWPLRPTPPGGRRAYRSGVRKGQASSRRTASRSPCSSAPPLRARRCKSTRPRIGPGTRGRGSRRCRGVRGTPSCRRRRRPPRRPCP